MQTALSIARPGSMVGYVGVPHGVELPIGDMFFRNVGVRGGSAPVRAYIPELLDDVLEERINPGRVLDFATDLDGVAEAYAAMDERRAIKSLVRVGTGLIMSATRNPPFTVHKTAVLAIERAVRRARQRSGSYRAAELT
jgi:hypothetical protein